MKSSILFTFAFLFLGQAHATTDGVSDEATCAANRDHMQAQVANSQVLEMMVAMKSILIEAYGDMGIQITEDKITFLSPTTSVAAREDGMDGDEMTTVMLANVSAGNDSIQAKGVSIMPLDRVTDRQSTMDKIGRVTETKLVCTVTGLYLETEVSNFRGGPIGSHSDAKDLIFSVELP